MLCYGNNNTQLHLYQRTKKKKKTIQRFQKDVGNYKLLNPTEESVTDTNMLMRNSVTPSEVVDFTPYHQVILLLGSARAESGPRSKGLAEGSHGGQTLLLLCTPSHASWCGASRLQNTCLLISTNVSHELALAMMSLWRNRHICAQGDRHNVATTSLWLVATMCRLHTVHL